MRLILMLITLVQLQQSQWIPVEAFDTTTKIDFSPYVSSDEVNSTYTTAVLEELLPAKLDDIASFRVEVILKSGYTISGVVKKWKRIKVDSASGAAKQNAVELKLSVEGWDYWDIEIFTVNVWYKFKSKADKRKL